MPDLHGQEREALEEAWNDKHGVSFGHGGVAASYFAQGYRAALAAREEPADTDCPTHRQSFLEGWEAARTEATDDPVAGAEAEEAWRLAWGDSPGAALAAREAKEASLDTDRPDGGDPVLPDGVEEPIASLHNALAILSLILLRAKTEPHRADRDRVRLLRFFSGEDTERPDAQIERLLKALRRVIRNDLTYRYSYATEPGRTENAVGEMPPDGQRWLTPREIAEDVLRDTERPEESASIHDDRVERYPGSYADEGLIAEQEHER